MSSTSPFSTALNNPEDVLSQTTSSLAGAQPIISHHKPRPPRFVITSRFVFFRPTIPSARTRDDIQAFVFEYLARSYAGVNVEFGAASTMHVAYGGHLSAWPKNGGIGPVVSGGFEGINENEAEKPGNEKIVVPGGKGPTEDPVKPIVEALEAARAEGVLAEGERYTIGPVIGIPEQKDQD